MARTIVRSLESKKGQDILLLDIQDIAAFTDYFVLCTGTSDRMLEALADAAVDSVRKTYRKRGLKQGEAREGWVVVDYGDVVLHLFSPEQRRYYRLAELWQDGRILLKVQ
jgi:ribosome-associated protein